MYAKITFGENSILKYVLHHFTNQQTKDFSQISVKIKAALQKTAKCVKIINVHFIHK